MLDISKVKEQNNIEDIKVKTNEGEFILSKFDDNKMYIGFLKKDIEDDFPTYFQITKENYEIFRSFSNFYFKLKGFNFNEGENFVTLLSDDMPKEDSSSLTMYFDELNQSINLIFTKSTSKVSHNSYFIEINKEKDKSKINHQIFEELFNKLNNYSPRHHQIDLEEILYEQRRIKQTCVRSRSISSCVTK